MRRRGAGRDRRPMSFRDRRDAGRRLAPFTAHLADERPVVCAVPRGGVPVAVEVAQAVGAPLDVVVVRKIAAPGHPEAAVGAVAEDGTLVLDPALVRQAGMSREALREAVRETRVELERRVRVLRDGRPPADVRGRTVVAVDDGLATGLTDLAAVRALRGRGAARVVVAAPVGSPEAVRMLAGDADEVVCPDQPRRLIGVGRWYRDFSQVSDEEVVGMLARDEPVR